MLRFSAQCISVMAGIAVAKQIYDRLNAPDNSNVLRMYRVEKILNDNLTIKLEFFANPHTDPLTIVNNFNKIFANYSLDDLIKVFAIPYFDQNKQQFIADKYYRIFAAYQAFAQSAPMPEFSITTIAADDVLQTAFGKQYTPEDVLVTFFNHQDNQQLCTFDFLKNDLVPEYFAKYYSKASRNLDGKHPQLAAINAHYAHMMQEAKINAANEDDLVKLALTTTDLRLELSQQYYDKINWKPALEILNAITLDALAQKQESLIKEAEFIKDKKGSTTHGITGLMVAAVRNCEFNEIPEHVLTMHLATVERLVKQGLNINAKDRWGRTALFYVAIGTWMFNIPTLPGRGKMTQKLLELGANPAITDVLGKTALDYHVLSGNTDHDGISLLQEKLKAVPKKRVLRI